MNRRKDFDDAIAGVQAAFHVSHIATSPLQTAPAQAPVSVVRSWAEPSGINNVPVVGDAGVLLGVLENVAGEVEGASPDGDQHAAQAMRRLSSNMLLESTTRLERVLEVLLEPPYYRLVLREGRVDAIVTPSD